MKSVPQSYGGRAFPEFRAWGRPGAVSIDRAFSTDLGISISSVPFVNCCTITFSRVLSAQLYMMKFGLVLSF